MQSSASLTDDRRMGPFLPIRHGCKPMLDVQPGPGTLEYNWALHPKSYEDAVANF